MTPTTDDGSSRKDDEVPHPISNLTSERWKMTATSFSHTVCKEMREAVALFQPHFRMGSQLGCSCIAEIVLDWTEMQGSGWCQPRLGVAALH
jgi:hypothetical protein